MDALGQKYFSSFTITILGPEKLSLVDVSNSYRDSCRPAQHTKEPFDASAITKNDGAWLKYMQKLCVGLE